MGKGSGTNCRPGMTLAPADAPAEEARQQAGERRAQISAGYQQRFRSGRAWRSEMESKARKHGLDCERYIELSTQRLREVAAEAELAVRTDGYTLEKVLRCGRLFNQHEAGFSGGFYMPRQRAELEAEVFSLRPDEVGQPACHPIYGYLSHAGEQLGDDMAMLGCYGDVKLVLKPETRRRTTIVYGDSLDPLQAGYALPCPLERPDARCVAPHADALGWQFSDSDNDYIEAQIHGGVELEDIAYVALPEPPSTDLAALLEEHSLSWRLCPPITERF